MARARSDVQNADDVQRARAIARLRAAGHSA